MKMIPRLSCTIFVASLAMSFSYTINAQSEKDLYIPFVTENNLNPLRVFIAEIDNHDPADGPPTLHSVADRLGSGKTPEDILPLLANLIGQYLQPLFSEEDKGGLAEQFDQLANAVQYPDGFDFSDQNALLGWGERLITGLADLSNAIIPTEQTTESLSPSYVGFAAFSLVSLLNDFKCRALNELVIADGENFTPLIEKLGDQGFCEVPGLGKITRWEFNAEPNNRSGMFRIEDMKIDRYSVASEPNNGSVTNVVYSLKDQLSFDWEVYIQGYDVSRLLSREKYEEALSVDGKDADPFERHPDYPSILDSSVKYPSLPDKAKKLPAVDGTIADDERDTIWGRELKLRIFAHGEGIVPWEVVRTGYKIVYKDENPDISILDLNENGDPEEFRDVYDRVFYRYKASASDSVHLSSNDPYRQKSISSCIDIMISADTVPLTFADFPKKQLGWCLGRCAHPLIANSK